MSIDDEESEVRGLLNRHRSQLIKDINDQKLVTILVKKDVINLSEEEAINNCGGGDQLNAVDAKCDLLIDAIAKSGFKKFKSFCYAIEEECPDLIHQMINDTSPIENTDPAATAIVTENVAGSEKEETEDADDIVVPENNRGTLDSDRSKRSTSYCAPPAITPPAAAQRTSLIAQHAPNVAQMVSKFNQEILKPLQPKLSTASSVVSTSSSSNSSTSTQQPTSSISSKVSDYSHTMPLPHKTKPQTKLEKVIQFANGTLRRKTQDNIVMDSSATSKDPSPAAVVKKRDKSSLKYRHSCSHQDDYAIYSEAKKFGRKRKDKGRRPYHSMNETIEVLADQVIEDDPLGERSSWEYHTVTVTRVSGYGFGIAVSGGRDNPHFANGDPSIAVSDVLKGGPAEEKLQVNDRIITVNGVSLENVEYATAVQVLRDSGNTVTLVVKRRVVNLNFLNSGGGQSVNAIASPTHQHQHSLSSTGLAGSATSGTNGPITAASANQQTIKLSITKTNKKDDFGIVLGCRLFVKEISSKVREQLTANGYSLQEGDIITRIHNTNCSDAMSLKEAKKIIDGCKDRLNMVVLRDVLNNSSPALPETPSYSHTAQVSNCSNIDDAFLPGGASYSSQNLYVQPPTRPSLNAPSMTDDKSNLTPRGRSRNPLLDASTLSQLDRPSTPPGGHSRSRSGIDEPPIRPPAPREDFYSSRRQLYEDDPLKRSQQSAEPRYITFQKEGSVGIRLTGGNEAGIFVTAVQPGSPASLQGLTPGDKILKVNDMDMQGVTREEAVLYLLSLQDRIDLIVQHSREEYDNIVASQRGDSFHIKTHFHCENPSKGEMLFKAGDVFRVTDTLHNGVVGSWQVLKIGRAHQEMQRGVIPNKSRAEELATAQFNASKKEMNASESRGSFFRRKRSAHRRSKSLSRENWDDVVFSDAISKFPAYERVVLRHPGFVRPVCLFGPIADLARERLIKDFPDKFTAPYQDESDKGTSKCGIVRLSNIRDIMDRGKHALLDITPNAVDRLNYAQFYPIVIFFKADSKMIVKRVRQGIPKSQHKSSKKLFETGQKLEKVWSHAFSVTINLTDTETWYRQLRDYIDQQQSGAVWMSATKPVESLSDDFLFPMNSSRLSYASSPESDLELSPGPSTSLSLGNLPQLVKSSSDPSIATTQDNLDRDRDLDNAMPPPYSNHYDQANPAMPRRPTSGENKFPYSSTNGQPENGGTNYSSGSRPLSNIQSPGIYAPDLPPRIDRASKPSGLVVPTSPTRNSSGAKNSSIHSIATLGRSAQERLFGGAKPTNGTDNSGEHDEYASRNQLIANKRMMNGNSLERSHHQHQASLERQQRTTNGIKMGNESYDSVSSYDSYNAGPNLRLGPNAPDDLKSVPAVNGRGPSDYMVNSPSKDPQMQFARPTGHNELSRSLSSGPNDLNRHNNSGYLNGSNGANDQLLQRAPVNIPQRPTNLGIEASPRKMVPFEAKTDYGKYSRNNSATQADYKGTKSPQIGPPPTSAMPFKPVPPPKPKNYRPPAQNSNGNDLNQWDNNGMEPITPRSPMNGYGGGNGYYQGSPAAPHYHHHQSQMQQPPMPSGYPPYPGGNPANGNFGAPSSHGYNNNTNSSHNMTTNYNGNHAYNGQYGQHRGFGNIPHPAERHALDLAGSREQRGSAFELYRKPQMSMVGQHPHNISSMNPAYANALNEQQLSYHHHHLQQQQQQQHYPPHQRFYPDNFPPHDSMTPPPLPPPIKPKRKLLKSPLAAIKNVFIKSTKPLRRQASLAEADKKMKSKSGLRRQHSMMEPRNYYMNPQSPNLDPRYQHYQQLPNRPPIPVDPYSGYPRNYNMPYPLPHVPHGDPASYQNYDQMYHKHQINYPNQYPNPEEENLYANRAFIDLQERARVAPNRGIIRRHSLADRPASAMHFKRSDSFADRNRGNSQEPTEEPIYQSQGGSYLLKDMSYEGDRFSKPNYGNQKIDKNPRTTDPVYQTRRELHRDHLYQSKQEMQQRIHQGRKEIEKGTSEVPSDSSSTTSGTPTGPIRDPIYVTRKELKENGFKTRTQLREHLYQTRREAMETMAEPIYVSRKSVQHEPIYEAREIDNSQEILNCDDDRKQEAMKETDSDDLDQILEQIQGLRVEDVHEEVNQKVSRSPDIEDSGDNMVSSTLSTNNNTEESMDTVIAMSPKPVNKTNHLSSVIKRTAPVPLLPPPPPPPPRQIEESEEEVQRRLMASRTSIETQYTSQASLPSTIGPPNASSTPYASDLSIAIAQSGNPNLQLPREPTTTRGDFDANGGVLSDPIWNVSLEIPKGAIPPGVTQEIYFTVTDPRLSECVGGPPLDMENGETMLSPLVMCGPQGLEFLVPVTLNIPHCAGRTTSLGLSLKATDSESNLKTNWDNIELPSNAAAHTVSVKVDHF